MTFAERLEEILVDRGKTKSDLARHLDIAPQSVGQWGAGVKPTLPRGKRLEKIASFLGVSQSELIAPPGAPFPKAPLQNPSKASATGDPGDGHVVEESRKVNIGRAWDKLPDEDKGILIGTLNGLLVRRGLPPIDR